MYKMIAGFGVFAAAAWGADPLPYVVGVQEPLYTVGQLNTDVSTLVPSQGSSALLTMAPQVLGSVLLIDRGTAYLGNEASAIYQMDLSNNTITTKYTGLPGPIYGMDILNATTGFATVGAGGGIYKFNPQTQEIGYFAMSGLIAVDIKIRDDRTACVIAFDMGGNNGFYTLDLVTGDYQLITPLPNASMTNDIERFQFADYNTAYAVDGYTPDIYKIDLLTAAVTKVNSSYIGSYNMDDNALWGITLNGNTAYVVNYDDNAMYFFDLNTQTTSMSSIAVAGSSGPIYLTGFMQMLTPGLSGNNLKLANYLNANAPVWAIRPFALQGSNLANALEAASPARNAFTTYASQNAYLASSQSLIDHSRQRRFHRQLSNRKPVAAFTADASDVVETQQEFAKTETARPRMKNAPMQKPYAHNVWFTPFGEYAREKAQMQSPAFSMSVGGGLLGYDYTFENKNTVGVAGSYVYTHVHEEEGMGSSNINQGFGTIYTTLLSDRWYADLSLWGGGYSGANVRKIKFLGVNSSANATITGGQLAGHVEMGYDTIDFPNRGLDWFGIEPFAMADVVGNWEGGFHEHGAGELNMGQKGRSAAFLRGEGGLRFQEIFDFDSGNRFVLREKTSYVYQKAFGTGHINAFLVGSPGSFTVDTLTGAQNLGVFELSMLYATKGGGYFDLRYQGEFGSKYISNQIMLEMGIDF